MKTIKSSVSMQRQSLSWRQNNQSVVLVPTMGFLHDGHAALITKGRKLAGNQGRLVVSIFVNPTQFSPSEDFNQYPRSERADLEMCRNLGADAVFMPRAEDIYPREQDASFSTYVTEDNLSTAMEGRSRPSHFRGVTTIVNILFNLTQPSHAIFGEKDFQQLAVIRKMVQDLRIPTKIVMGKTVRERDGLALSSRNAYLNSSQRRHATILWRCIQAARNRIKQTSKPIQATTLKRQLTRMVESTPQAQLDYIEFFNPTNLKPPVHIQQGDRIALAVRFGRTRLIDNSRI